VRTKGLQLTIFLMLSVLLIQPMGPLRAAIRRCNGRLRMLPYVMRVGVGSGDPIVIALGGLDAICCRMCALALCRGCYCKPAGERASSRRTARQNPEIEQNEDAGRDPARGAIRLDLQKIRRFCLRHLQTTVGTVL
jgi:hypothetical protein